MDILVSEVGPRDGLQSVERVMRTADKHRWIAALAQAGLREIEVGSFVSPRALPQMADCAEVVAQALTIRACGWSCWCRISNMRNSLSRPARISSPFRFP
jgi:isopropylmalate/homocitrate/citramalate synthase